MSIRRFLFVLAAGLTLAQPAHAQLDKPDPPPDSSDPWYRQQLVQLSEVLGGTHYLYTLCTSQGDQRWREYERGVIQRAPDYSDVMVEAFNRGYREQQQRFSTCDPEAQQAENDLRASGLRLSQGLSVRRAQ